MNWKRIVCAAVKFAGIAAAGLLGVWLLKSGVDALSSWLRDDGTWQLVVAYGLFALLAGAMAFCVGAIVWFVWLGCYESCDHHE